MTSRSFARHSWLGLLALASLVVLCAGAGSASAYTPGCGGIPIVHGIPPWGFHTGPGIGATGTYARGHGDYDFANDTVSGIICQEEHFRDHPDRAITMTVGRHFIYHSHYAQMWGYPGNIMKIYVYVRASNDPACKVGTRGRATLFASYNGVRSDSVQFSFRSSCRDQNRLYHGTQVNNQVPPL
ncbi:MAG TPA: hypothetical protein VMA83_06415 [Solirubrobacteraceae bacterium]|nr:hypothetical protein [Solirubrobacteraceae bacterium]